MSSAVLSIMREAYGSIECGKNVVFEHVLYSGGNINYDPATGEITLQETGEFLVQWWVALQSAVSKTGAVLALSTSQGELLYGNSPDKTGEVCGLGLVEVTVAPVTLRIINACSGVAIYASATPVKAALLLAQYPGDPVIGPTGPEGPTGPAGLVNLVDGNNVGAVRGIGAEDTSTMGVYAVATGQLTAATGDFSSAEGYACRAEGDYAHAEGINSWAGLCSHAEGSLTVASADGSHAEGKLTRADGESSHAEGFGTRATAHASHAEGSNTIASTEYAHAEGYNTTASGDSSHTEGANVRAEGDYSHAEGSDTGAIGQFSHAEGYGTIASGNGAHTQGIATQASGEYSHAEGRQTEASMECAHAEGSFSIASGYASHAEGEITKASNEAAHAEGYYSKATGWASHAEGMGVQAIRNFSHAEGDSTTAKNTGAHIMGKNGDTNADYSWFLANGNNGMDKSIAAKILSTGNAYIANAWINGMDYAELFETADGQPIEPGYFVTFSIEGDKVRRAGAGDDYILGIISATPGVIGDSGELHWKDKYVTDEWGRIQYHEVTVEDVKDKDGNVKIPAHTQTQPILNPAWDPALEYIPRSKRPEWVLVGLLGKLLVRDDGSCTPGGYCLPNADGIAARSEKGYRVLKRTGERQIQILFR